MPMSGAIQLIKSNAAAANQLELERFIWVAYRELLANFHGECSITRYLATVCKI